jgi:hypothetical protein
MSLMILKAHAEHALNDLNSNACSTFAQNTKSCIKDPDLKFFFVVSMSSSKLPNSTSRDTVYRKK